MLIEAENIKFIASSWRWIDGEKRGRKVQGWQQFKCQILMHLNGLNVSLINSDLIHRQLIILNALQYENTS